MAEEGNAPSPGGPGPLALVGYVVLGAYFGVVLTKSEAVSWFRIQEMFRFQAFHMFGLIGGAVVVAMLSLEVIRRSGVRARDGRPIVIPLKERTRLLVRYWAGGTLFGLGWALLGACPGPLYALIGHGLSVYVVGLAAALAGTWAYGLLRERLPH
jgi:uncharacterized membrane protein YedE/YeeE